MITMGVKINTTGVLLMKADRNIVIRNNPAIARYLLCSTALRHKSPKELIIPVSFKAALIINMHIMIIGAGLLNTLRNSLVETTLVKSDENIIINDVICIGSFSVTKQ